MKRIITGLIVSIIWLLLLFAGSFVLFWLAILLITLIALYEYFAITLKNPTASRKFICITTASLPLLAASSGRPDLVAAGLFLALLICIIISFKGYALRTAPFDFMTSLEFGMLYIGFGLAHLPLLMAQPQGYLWLLLLSTITIASDTGAYCTGTMIGKHKLCAAISPGKTLEGFIGGLLCAVIAAVAVSWYFLPDSATIKIIILAIVLSCIGVISDLTESVIKRSAGVKDSGSVLPGHGGILDRIDSMLLTAPTLFYLLYLGFI